MVHMHILTIFCNKIPWRYLPLGSTFRPKQISRQVRVFAEVHPPAAMQAKWVKRRYTSHSLGVLGCKEWLGSLEGKQAQVLLIESPWMSSIGRGRLAVESKGRRCAFSTKASQTWPMSPWRTCHVGGLTANSLELAKILDNSPVVFLK